MRKTILGTMFLLSILSCSSPERKGELPVDKYGSDLSGPAEDLARFAQLLETMHPALYRFVSKTEFERNVTDIIDRINDLDAPTQFEIGRAYQEIIAPVGDFHMQVALPIYQPEHAAKASLLPLHLIEVDEAFILDASSAGLPAGTRLLSIDGEAIEALWREARAIVSEDGDGEAPRDAELSLNFPKYYHLIRGTKPSYVLEVQPPGESAREITLDGVNGSRMSELITARLSHKAQGLPDGVPWPTLHRPAPGVAMVRMHSFGVADMDAYAERLDDVLAQLDAPELLIFDVRQNTGGFRTYGIQAINRVAHEPYTQWRQMSVKAFDIPDALASQVVFYLAPQEALRQKFPDAPAQGPAIAQGDPLAALMEPSDPLSKDTKVAVLIDGKTNSAANEFVLGLKIARPDVVLVGQEIGGDCDAHVGEFPALWRSDHSGVLVAFSLIEVRHVEISGCQPGRGLLPDRQVFWTLEDLQEGNDPFVTRALKIASEESATRIEAP